MGVFCNQIFTAGFDVFDITYFGFWQIDIDCRTVERITGHAKYSGGRFVPDGCGYR